MAEPEILVVDDDVDVRKLLKLLLEGDGFSVRIAADGRRAIELFRHNQKTIDVVLTDVNMPDQDGPTTLAALQKIDPEVRCCFMSGHLGKYSIDQLLDLGAAHVFPKPFTSIAELRNTLRRLAEERRSARQ
jgi:two-component system cell cycle sensor histidine kinase/response regulator CckA